MKKPKYITATELEYLQKKSGANVYRALKKTNGLLSMVGTMLRMCPGFEDTASDIFLQVIKNKSLILRLQQVYQRYNKKGIL